MLLKKKISSLAFLAITVVPYLLFSFFLLQQQYIKWEKRKALEKEPLETIIIATADIVWFEKGKEIIIHNKLFDVASFSEENGLLTISGIYDGDETHLLQKLNGLSEKHKKKALQSQAFLALLLTGYHQTETSSNPYYSIKKTDHSEKPIPVVSPPFIPIQSPPPQFL
ncbi:MAG: hypothetical protein JWP69_1379 [Flaviaesturariibacter sp.]|nr:hypothetical protein [Flaviaesturariibacter sp.]